MGTYKLEELQNEAVKEYGYLNFEDWTDTKRLSDQDVKLLTDIIQAAVVSSYNTAVADCIERLKASGTNGAEDLKNLLM